jgi:DNA-binding FadR family transcriptional regulator
MGKGILVEGGIEDAISRHREIYQAFCNRDREAVHRAMADHLKVSSLNVQFFDKKGTTVKTK